MKVIGKNREGLLVEVTEYEIMLLHGFSSTYDDGWRLLKKNYERSYQKDFDFEGLEIDIKTLSEKVHYLRDRESSVLEAIRTFRNMADALEIAWPSFKEITKK